MPDIWIDVDTAVTVPVNIMPLLDDTDFKTRETAIAFDAAGMDLTWNFVTCAGAQTQTAVTPTSAGNYDWTHVGDGIYKIELPASGGASANNDTEGFGWFTGFVTGVLPWRGPTIGFRRAALNDMFIDGSTASTNFEDEFDGTGYAGGTIVRQADVTKWLGTAAATPTVAGVPEVDITHLGGAAQSATDLKDFADDGYDPATNKVQGVVLTDTVTTYTGNTVQTGDAFARLGAPAGASVSADIAAIEAQTDDIGAAGAGLTGVPWNAAWDAEVQSEVEDALVVHRLDELLNADSDIDGAAPPTVGSVFHELMSKTAGSFTFDQTTDSNEAIRDATALASVCTEGRLSELDAANLPTDVAGVQSDTDNIQTRIPAALVGGRMDSSTGAMAADVLTASALAADAGNEIADAILDRNMATGTDSGSTTVRTVRQALRTLRNKVSESAGTLTITKEDDATASWTAAVTTNAALNPIESIDPAGP